MSVRLSPKKFINTAATPYVTTANGECITIGVFFDATHASCLPFWISLRTDIVAGLALDLLCRAANVQNRNNSAKSDDDKWHIFCLTSGPGIFMDMAVATSMRVEELAVNGDIWFVTKGTKAPEGLEDEALRRLAKIGSRSKAKPAAAPPADEVAGAAASSAAAAPGPSPSIVNITASFPELDEKKVTVSVHADAIIADVLAALRAAEPQATRSGLRIMFFEKYVRRETDPIRAVPLADGAVIDACTGRFLSENEMTLYLGDRKLREVKEAMAAHEGPIAPNLQAYWGEQLMKSLMFFDSLQEVPEDIRLRRKAAVKAVMEVQQILGVE